MPKYMAVKHRAMGSSSVHFGPFENLSDLYEWAQRNSLTVGVVELVDPDSPSEEWWL